MTKFWEWLKSLFKEKPPETSPKTEPEVLHPIDPDLIPGHRGTTLSRWRKAQITNSKALSLKIQSDKIISFKREFYDPVEKEIGVPWYVVGAIDMRESNFNHRSYLGNGQSLNKVTTIVPKGRGPFSSWYLGAIDALRLQGFDKVKHWDIVTALIHLEGYNGLGYKSKGLPSPYIWAGTNIQVSGKYVADGHFDAGVWDSQPGCAGVLLALKIYHGIDLGEA